MKRSGGSVVSCAVLMAFGVDESGHRAVLGVSVSLSEAEVHWRDFFAHLQGRGLSGVRLLISDDHAGMKAAREARFPGVPWQRCQFHLQQNAGHYVPRIEMRREVAGDLRAIFESHGKDQQRAETANARSNPISKRSFVASSGQCCLNGNQCGMGNRENLLEDG